MLVATLGLGYVLVFPTTISARHGYLYQSSRYLKNREARGEGGGGALHGVDTIDTIAAGYVQKDLWLYKFSKQGTNTSEGVVCIHSACVAVPVRFLVDRGHGISMSTWGCPPCRHEYHIKSSPARRE